MTTTSHRPPVGAEELVLFEDLRLGSGRALRRLVELHDPAMRRVARLHLGEADPGPVIRRMWGTALPGLDMFTWHTSFRAWLFGILLTYARAAGPGPVVPRPPTRPVPSDDDVPWASLAWSRWWGPDGEQALAAAVTALPPDAREVLWLTLAEGWPAREAYEALALTAGRGATVQAEATTAVGVALAHHYGRSAADAPGSRDLAALLAATATARGTGARTPDAELLAILRSWRRDRGLGPWQRLLHQVTRRARRARRT